MVNFWPLKSIFFRIFAQKRPFFVLAQPQLVSLARKVLFFFKIGKFLDLILKCFRNFWSKKFFFYAEAQPQLLFLFFFKTGKFLDLILKCFRNFWSKKFLFYAETQPQIVFLAQKVFFLENWLIFGQYTQIFSQILGQKNLFFFFLSSAPAFFFSQKSFFFKLFNLLPEKSFFLLLKLSPSLFFLAQIFFFLNCSIFCLKNPFFFRNAIVSIFFAQFF